jgi:16S rRNA (uracil1498-N3)-methyltransferase
LSKESFVLNRFFLPDLQPAVDEVVPLAPIHKQLRHVLRLLPGSQIVILDNQGNERLMELATSTRLETTARVVEVRRALPETPVPVILYQCILKGDKFDLVLQKATELGVSALVPVISNRTIARPSRALEGKQARWNTIVREAAEQCGRGGLPIVNPPCAFDEAIAHAVGVSVLPWEEALGDPGLLAALTQTPQPVESVGILIGPEGGLEAGEVDAAISAGWQVVSMGPRILRAETAALAAVSVVMSALGQLGDAPSVKLSSPSKEGSKEKEGKPRKHRSKKEPHEVKSSHVDSADEGVGSASAPSSVGSTTVGAV